MLLRHLDRERFIPFLLVPEEDELSEAARRLGVETFVLPLPRLRSLNAISTMNSILKLLKIIRKHQINVIHTESPRDAFYSSVVKMLSGVPVIFHARVSDAHPWGDRLLYCLCDRLIAVSGAAAKRFVSRDKRSKVSVVYNGVDLEMFRPLTREVRNASLRVGYFGQIQRRKGIDVLIRAIQKVSGNSSLTVMGDGDLHYLEELKKMSAGYDVHFKKYSNDVLDDIACSDVVVLPAVEEEGLSRMIIEAMAMGKVVIASDLESNREALGDELKDFLFPVGDDSGLAAIIRKLIEEREIISDMKGKTRERAERLFEIKKNTCGIEKVYESVVAC